MTTLREAATMALEALHVVLKDDYSLPYEKIVAATDALKTALAEPVQEPVAWMNKHGACTIPLFKGLGSEHDEYNTPLYTAPLNLNDPAVQKRLAAQWGYVKAEPLTDDEIRGLWVAETKPVRYTSELVRAFARAIERAHGIGGQDAQV